MPASDSPTFARSCSRSARTSKPEGSARPDTSGVLGTGWCNEAVPVHLTRSYHALALDFSLAVESEELGRYLEWLLDGFVEPDGPVTRYSVVRGADDSAGVRLLLDGELVLQATDARAFVASLVQWLNQQATNPEYAVMSHAGGVERGGVACVLPAHMESGKTTLTTGLVRKGFAYLTDEAVAFDWETGEIDPYPKPLSIDPGSQFLFRELTPPLPPGVEATDSAQWQIPPSAIRPDAVGTRCWARYVVFPNYEEGATTLLQPIGRAEGLVELAKNTFQFREHPRRGLDSLARVIRDVDCYRLTVGDLDRACELIDDLMGADRA